MEPSPILYLGAIGIFIYVGAEVSIGSYMVKYLERTYLTPSHTKWDDERPYGVITLMEVFSLWDHHDVLLSFVRFQEDYASWQTEDAIENREFLTDLVEF